jgi:stage II sporulation protein D
MKKSFLIPIVILSFFLGFAAFAANRGHFDPLMVRVAIVRDARQIDLEIAGKYSLTDPATAKIIDQGDRFAKSTVRLLDKGIFIGGHVYPNKRIIIQPVQDASVTINSHRFRGAVFLLRTPEDRITVINNINIEDYVKGVLYHEVSHHWPMEALKAQAVATRTYAIFAISAAKNKDYDVTNDIYSQVYGGKNSERYRTGLAVDRTTGEVLTYKHKILPAYFHATCAGMTEDIKELWNMDLPPLKGVPCEFCKEAPHMKWTKNFRLKDIQDKLNEKGYAIGLIKDISIVSRNRSGRINQLKIIDRSDKEITIAGKDFRELIGPNIIRSNNYEIIMKGYFMDVVGKGWGHGAGMCQWGARGMALQQFTYKQILSYYYPGAEQVDYHELSH